MPPQPPSPFLECPHCKAPFLPNIVAPGVFTTCPQCFANFQLGEARVAASPQLEIRPWQTAEAVAAEAAKDRNRRYFRLVIKAAVAVAILGGLAFWKFGMGSRNQGKLDEPSTASDEQAETREAFAAARQALESSDWQGMSGHVLNPAQVRPMMEWYYGQKPGGFVRRQIEGFDQGLIDLEKTPVTATMRVQAVKPPGALHVVMVKAGEGWKLDWESFSNVHGSRWESFLSGHPSLPEVIEAPVVAERYSSNLLVPSFFASSGLDPADAVRAVRVFHPSADVSGVACFPQSSAVGSQLMGLLSESGNAGKFVLKVRRLPKVSVPQGIVIESIMREGWGNPSAPDQPSLEGR